MGRKLGEALIDLLDDMSIENNDKEIVIHLQDEIELPRTELLKNNHGKRNKKGKAKKDWQR